mmetsp:Transcript_9163/g.10989  ORF Transcript_9163/g.10989 Transcript_9163/m.10989 type:complete len:336 (-) Transcript_9163:21-1028(-)
MAEENEEIKLPTWFEAIRAHFFTVVIFGIGWGLAVAGDGPLDESTNFKLTILETTALISFGIQIVAFVFAFAAQTEKFYDFTGTITYLTCTWYTFGAGLRASDSSEVAARPVIVSVLVTVWALRLGSFLVKRIRADKKDGRFDALKPSFALFLMTWMLQGLWVFLTAYAVYIINVEASSSGTGLVASDYVGLLIWLAGFALEVTADEQKKYWRSKPENKGQFINYGLWYYSRHPNYFGEMTLWFGIFVMSLEVLDGSQYCAVLSPIFVFCLLNFISGVPLLENRADKKFADNAAYWEYKRNTSVLIPLPKGWGGNKSAGPKLEREGSAPIDLETR